MSYYRRSSAIDVTLLSVSRYHHEYPTTLSRSRDPLLWKTLVKDLYSKFSDKVWLAEILDKEKDESLYRVCATYGDSMYYHYTRSHLNRFDFCRRFAMRDDDQRTPTSEFDLFVGDFLRHEFRSANIDTRYCVASREGRGCLPAGFSQMLVELCKDTFAVVDFMELSARQPFTSDLDRLLRNFCYHVLVKETAQSQFSLDVWERHSRSMYRTYSYLRHELDNRPQEYDVIRTFLGNPQFNDNNADEVMKRYLMSTAFLNIVLRGTKDKPAAKKVLKYIKEAVEEVDACQRATFFPDYSRKTISDGICDRLLKGIRLVLQAQCVRDAQTRIRAQTWRSADDLKLSAIEDYQHLAKEGWMPLTFGWKDKIDKWVKKVDASCEEHEVALLEATGLMDY